METFSLDQFHSLSFLGSSSSNPRKNCCFASKLRNWSKPISQICCYSKLEHGLLSKPEKKNGFDEKKLVLVEPVIKRRSLLSPSGLCSQIEKLVLSNKYMEAMELFEMLELEFADSYVGASTYDALITACIRLRFVRGVKRVFNHIRNSGFELDLYMMNRVLYMHVKCFLMHDARKLFDDMSERYSSSWMIMIGGLVDAGNYSEAFEMFLCMWEEFNDGKSRTFATMLRASAGLGSIEIGKQIHTCILKRGVNGDQFVDCALIDMYSKSGSIEDAQCVFDQMPQKTTVGWNTIIAGYALRGYSEEALGIYCKMRDSGAKIDHFTISIVIRICARLASLEHAKQAHAALVRRGFGTDLVVNSALVDFYSKWGRMKDAQSVFDKMHRKNVISWNALIGGYGNHGQGEKALQMFEKMLQENMIPNHVTFLAVLSACSYSGLSERGWEIFESMSRDHNVKPRAMHYACMIELLGREGLLDDAVALIRNASFKPTLNMWAALLTACRMHENLELGTFAAEKLYGMKPEKLCNYVVLLNIYNKSSKLKEAAGVLQTLKRKGLTMIVARSWIEVKKQPYAFFCGDKSHPQMKEIYKKVDSMMVEISRHGYVVEEETLLPDVDEEEQRVIKYHSEKLAIAFGIINTPGWLPLQITQSHRVCGDCHNAIKLITKVTRREIVLRDASRFHHFKNGSCSCGDYW
ncbi:pentatricopeptide repeat-containing protein At5g50390, chloroplastic-like [Vicia villosa]|uniref:pentatricopeptide repeat-containing protein At5g50390, chloroplastic-like n=1 Tax=Vicia villosa TaxID=3911 RepID=UPI00273BDB5D|nr:pentatricopeptide repeat-containing protein At5g50390, chloroplastic-like [Vicia villosa]